MPIQTIDGRRVHTQVLGDAGPRVVLIHGMLIGSVASWYFSIAPPLSRRHRVLMYDLRGHGKSEIATSGYGFRALGKDLRGVVEYFAGGEPVSLVGHSYGAVVALRFALDYPELVNRLVVVEATLPVITDEGVELLTKETAESLVEMLPPWQKSAFDTGGRRSQKIVAQFERLATETTMLADLMAEPDISDEDLRSLTKPVLLSYGMQTPEIMDATRIRLASTLPNARLEMFDTGHLVPLEAPRKLAEMIGDFLDT